MNWIKIAYIFFCLYISVSSYVTARWAIKKVNRAKIEIPIDHKVLGHGGHFLVPNAKGLTRINYNDGIVTQIWAIENDSMYQIWPIDWWLDEWEESERIIIE